jgi:tRNA A37 threonylcarbamoyladenosine modification protein TsaB
MYLFVDTTLEGEIFLALLDERGSVKKKLTKKISKPLSEVFLTALDHFLKRSEDVLQRKVQRGRAGMVSRLGGTSEAVVISGFSHAGAKGASFRAAHLSGIIVVPGPGRFTTLRVTLATLNAIAWQLQIPIAGIPAKEKSAITNYKLLITQLQKRKTYRTRELALPLYGQEPSITIK